MVSQASPPLVIRAAARQGMGWPQLFGPAPTASFQVQLNMGCNQTQAHPNSWTDSNRFCIPSRLCKEMRNLSETNKSPSTQALKPTKPILQLPPTDPSFLAVTTKYLEPKLEPKLPGSKEVTLSIMWWQLHHRRWSICSPIPRIFDYFVDEHYEGNYN